METTATAILFSYLVVCGIGTFRGIDLNRITDWLYGTYGFLSGLAIGVLLVDARAGLVIGSVFSFIVMYGGAIVRWHRERFK